MLSKRLHVFRAAPCAWRSRAVSTSHKGTHARPLSPSFATGSSRSTISERLTLPAQRWASSSASTASTLRTELLHEIDTQPVVIFSKSNCPACASAKKKFAKLGVEPTIFELDLGGPQAAAEVSELLADLTGETALPIVFVAGKYTSGSDALAGALKDVKATIEKRALKATVLEEIEANPVVMFSKSYCKNSIEVKQVFQQIRAEPATFELDSDKMRGNKKLADELQAILAEMTDVNSAPWVFIGGSFVGSKDETVALATSGMLRGLVDNAIGPRAPSATLRQMVLHEIQSSPVVLFSKSSCALCTEATSTFENLGVMSVVFDFEAGSLEVATELQTVLSELTGGLTGGIEAPYIFVGGSFIGGSGNASALASSGRLRELVESAMRVRTAPATVREMVSDELRSNAVVIFAKSYCPLCTQTKQAFQDMDVEVASFDLDAGEHTVANELQEFLRELTGRTALPQVFIGGSFVAAGDDVAELIASARTTSLVDAAVARKPAAAGLLEHLLGSDMIQLSNEHAYNVGQTRCTVGY